MSKLLCKFQALPNVLWRYKVLRNLDAAAEVTDLHTDRHTCTHGEQSYLKMLANTHSHLCR